MKKKKKKKEKDEEDPYKMYLIFNFIARDKYGSASLMSILISCRANVCKKQTVYLLPHGERQYDQYVL